MKYFVYCDERDTQQQNTYTKHAFRERLPVTATLGRVNEVSQCVYVVLLLYERNAIHC